MLEWNAINAWIEVAGGALLNLITAGLFTYGAFYSRFRLPFLILVLACLLFLVPQTYWLILKLQHSFGIVMLPKAFWRFLFPVQAVSMYVGIITQLTGDALLVWQVCRVNITSHTLTS